MTLDDSGRALVGAALEELVMRARGGAKPCRIGLMAAGGEHGPTCFLEAARMALAADPCLVVVGVGPLPRVPLPCGMEWIEAEDDGSCLAKGMEKALADGRIDGAVALHYPFPLGVTTIGKVMTPALGRAMFIAASTGMSATQRACSMLHNAVLGKAVAKALGEADPGIGVLNLEAAPQVLRALIRLHDNGYPLRFAQSARADGGSLLRGNDLLMGSADVCVTDTLTGNVLMKLFAAFTSGGGYETTGWGYGPSVGDGWDKVVSIVSRASGTPVIANALAYTATCVRADLPRLVAEEYRLARLAGLNDELETLRGTTDTSAETVTPPPTVPTDEEIHGVDVLDLEKAVRVLWQMGIYAEAAMGCTGPVVKLPAQETARATAALHAAGYL